MTERPSCLKISFSFFIFHFQFSPCTIFNFISLLCASFLFLYSAFLLDSVIINNERPFPQYRYNITTEPVSIFLSSGGSRISRGRQPQRWGSRPVIWPNFPPKLHKTLRNWTGDARLLVKDVFPPSVSIKAALDAFGSVQNPFDG